MSCTMSSRPRLCWHGSRHLRRPRKLDVLLCQSIRSTNPNSVEQRRDRLGFLLSISARPCAALDLQIKMVTWRIKELIDIDIQSEIAVVNVPAPSFLDDGALGIGMEVFPKEA